MPHRKHHRKHKASSHRTVTSKSGRKYRKHPKTGKYVLVRGHLAKNPKHKGKHRVRAHRAKRAHHRRR